MPVERIDAKTRTSSGEMILSFRTVIPRELMDGIARRDSAFSLLPPAEKVQPRRGFADGTPASSSTYPDFRRGGADALVRPRAKLAV
jgi:hypothetical protein